MKNGNPSEIMERATCGFPEIRGTILGGLYDKHFHIFGSMLESPHFGKLPLLAMPHAYMTQRLISACIFRIASLENRKAIAEVVLEVAGLTLQGDIAYLAYFWEGLAFRHVLAPECHPQ